MIVVRMLMLVLIKQRPCQNAEFANFFSTPDYLS